MLRRLTFFSTLVLCLLSLGSCENKKEQKVIDLENELSLTKRNPEGNLVILDSILSVEKDSIRTAQAYLLKGNILKNNQNRTLFINYNNDVIKLVDNSLKTEKNELRRAQLLFIKAQALSNLNQSMFSIKCFEKALIIFKKLNTKEYVAKTLRRLGSINVGLAKLEQGTEQLLEAIKVSKEINEKIVEANAYSSLSHAFYQYKDFDKSLDQLFKASEIYKEFNDTLQLSGIYNNLAILYRNKGNYDKAIDFNKKSLEINLLYNDSIFIAKSYSNLGRAYLNSDQDKLAISYLKKAATINKIIDYKNTSPLRNLAEYYFGEKDYDNAQKHYLQILTDENQRDVPQNTLIVYDRLLEIALMKEDFKMALEIKKLRDESYEKKTQADLKEKLNLVENQFALVSQDNELKQIQEINKRNTIVFISTIGIILLLSLILFQTIKNKSLRNEKERIALEQNVLRTQMNPHFIFNALSAIQNSLLDNNPLKSATYLSQFANLIRQNFDNVEKESISLHEELSMLENYVATQKLRFEDKFDFEIIIDDDIDTHEIQIPPLFLQPFVENSIEHGFKNISHKGLITIEIKDKSEKIHYTIKDNGKGYNATDADGKKHSSQVFLRRLKLMAYGDEKSYSVSSNKKGTVIKFSIQK